MAALPILIFGGIWITLTIGLPFFANGQMPRSARWLLHAAGVLTAFGGLIFLLPLAVNAGGFLPNSVEWPVGQAKDAVETESGLFVVPHGPSGRVQVYDQNMQFVTGWHVETDGGIFRLAEPADMDDVVDVYAVRLKQRSRYSLDGTLVSQVPYTNSDIALAGTGDRQVSTPTSWWQWPLTSPAFGAAIIMPGIATTLGISRKYDVTMPLDPRHRRI